MLFNCTNLFNFISGYDLSLYNAIDEEMVDEIEDLFYISNKGYFRKCLLKNNTDGKYSLVDIIAKDTSLIIIQYKKENGLVRPKVYNLDTKWQEYLLEIYGESYASILINDARSTKKQLVLGYEHKYKLSGDDSLKSELARMLARESKKEILAVNYLKQDNQKGEGGNEK